MVIDIKFAVPIQIEYLTKATTGDKEACKFFRLR